MAAPIAVPAIMDSARGVSMQRSAPTDSRTLNFSGAATAITCAPRRLANWMAAKPTFPDAPVIITVSPAARPARLIKFSAVP